MVKRGGEREGGKRIYRCFVKSFSPPPPTPPTNVYLPTVFLLYLYRYIGIYRTNGVHSG